jgi:hypothetical protein
MNSVMQHPVFGRIEWLEGMGQWTGHAQLDFFSAYDMSAEAACAERTGGTKQRTIRDESLPNNAIELTLIMPGRNEPTARQERAYLDLLGDHERICNRVVDAIFDIYRGNWGQWRSPAEPGREEFYADEILIPELTDRDGLKALIALQMLSVFDHRGILGFCFGCTWDPEHGLGVLVREGKVIEVGENDITWSPTSSGPERLPEAPTDQQIALQRGIAAVAKLGGRVVLEPTDDEPSVQVDLVHNTQIHDADLELLKPFPFLHQLKLNSNRITDDGLNTIRTFHHLQLLEIPGARITDAGLKALGGCKDVKSLYLTGTKVTDSGLAELRNLPKLIGLYLNGANVSDVGLKELGTLSGLKHLGLSGTRITDSGLQELKDLRSLLTLDLQDTAVTDSGLATLRELKSLRYLILSGCRVTDAGLEHLKELKTLRSLKLASTATTEAGLAALREALPGLQVDRF